MRIRPSVATLIAVGLLCQSIFAQVRGAGARLAEGEQKVALVIGNADYDQGIGRLRNPANDAGDVAEVLKRLGFRLVGGRAHLNLGKRPMLEQIREFSRQLKWGGVGVFYFAGHGVQIDKRNYLIPITDSLRFQEDAEFEAVEVDQILREMEYAENSLNILILDACRNNNLPRKTRAVAGGLGEPQRKPSGVYLAFAARDGQTAAENPEGRNGLYTQELLKNLETPNLRLEDIFINTRREVKRLSNKRQEPIEYGSVDGIFYFKKDEPPASVVRPSPTPGGSSGSHTDAAKDLPAPERPKRVNTSKENQPQPNLTEKSQTARATAGAFVFELISCARDGGDVLCQFTVSNESTESRQFNLCHADYRAKRRGLDVTHAWDSTGNTYALAESSVGGKRWTQASYNQTVLPPRVPVKLTLRFANVPAESDTLALIKVAVAEQTNMVKLLYADFRNVSITR